MSTRRGGDQHAYPIVTVDDRWAAGPEQMGSKPKFWCLPDGQEALRLFKFPQAGTGQHWAEKIAAEVAACLGILHAAVDLAVFRRYRGSVSTSFTHRKRRRELSHGNELLGWTRPYDPDKRFGQSDHNLVNIFRALEDVFKTEAGARSAKRQLAEYIVLDGLIGNTDRHHENWGLLLKRTRSALWGIVAPTFDHASSLGRELSDEKRRTRLQNGTVGQYSEKGGAPFSWAIPAGTAQARSTWCAKRQRNTPTCFGSHSPAYVIVGQDSRRSFDECLMNGCPASPRTSRWHC